MIIWYIIAGLLGGVVAGMGMGGGSLVIPILTVFLKFSQIEAQGINLIAFLPMSLVAIFIHAKNGLINFKQTWLLPLVGVFFSLGGAWLANNIEVKILRILFAVFLIGLGIWQLVELILQIRRDHKKKPAKREQVKTD